MGRISPMVNKEQWVNPADSTQQHQLQGSNTVPAAPLDVAPLAPCSGLASPSQQEIANWDFNLWMSSSDGSLCVGEVQDIPVTPETAQYARRLGTTNSEDEPFSSGLLDDICWTDDITLNDPNTIASETPQKDVTDAQSYVDLANDSIDGHAKASNTISLDNILATLSPYWKRALSAFIKIPQALSQQTVGSVRNTLRVNSNMSTLESYPKMMGTSILPPFIHSQFTSSAYYPNNSKTFEFRYPPLIHCEALTAMLYKTTPTSRDFVLGQLRSEVQRLHGEYTQYDITMIVASIQALVLYMITLASMGDPSEQLASLVVTTLAEIFVYWSTKTAFSHTRNGYLPEWEDWIIDESIRRTIVLLCISERTLNMKVSNLQQVQSIAYMPQEFCSGCEGFNRTPLLCVKELWEAKTKNEWCRLYIEYEAQRKSKKILTFGVLKTLIGSSNVGDDAALVEDLEYWSRNTDDFGKLMLHTLLE